ncbi:RseA family anti-sigma factor [Candidatus Regiella endosymbiont of Tuberolachnus salignus]|uniref:RseA family anti-sigma factor n=1 Tax=Candidatus Regiella endosymbiont of Tuberolachnus salignus TaxID=3077956 RepID=UPI0030CC9C12
MKKEKLSALIDGENFDAELINSLSKDEKLQQSWRSYHLIRDILRTDDSASGALNLDVSQAVADVIKKESGLYLPPMTEESPASVKWPTLQKISPRWISQITQVAIAACVCVAVLISVQSYEQPAISDLQPESPTFNTLPIFNTLPVMGMKASPVGLNGDFNKNQTSQVEELLQRIAVSRQQYFGSEPPTPYTGLDYYSPSTYSED